MPPGHLNALFIEDINKLKNEDPMIQIQEAVRQGGFIFWNHPGAQQVSSQWWEFHSILLEKGWLHGVEVASVKLHPPPGTTAMFAHSQDGGDPVKFKLLNCYSGSNHHPVVEINITYK